MIREYNNLNVDHIGVTVPYTVDRGLAQAGLLYFWPLYWAILTSTEIPIYVITSTERRTPSI